MFVGHLPAGFLITRAMVPAATRRGVSERTSLATGLGASVIPDLDLLYFYLVDHGRHLHHSYMTHTPAFWIVVFGALGLCTSLLRNTRATVLIGIAAVNVLGHLLLDTVSGKIRWLSPMLHDDFVFFHVPAKYGWWVWNFVLHWTFLLELALVAVALYALLGSRVEAREVVRGAT